MIVMACLLHTRYGTPNLRIYDNYPHHHQL